MNLKYSNHIYYPPSHLTCVLQAGRGVSRRREAERPGLECRWRLVADALGPLPALNGQASSAGLVTIDPAGCAGVGWWCGQTAGQERTRRSEMRERKPPREEAGFGGGKRERDRVKQEERCKQKRGGERQSSQWDGGASPCHAEAGTMAHTHGETQWSWH